MLNFGGVSWECHKVLHFSCRCFFCCHGGWKMWEKHVSFRTANSPKKVTFCWGCFKAVEGIPAIFQIFVKWKHSKSHYVFFCSEWFKTKKSHPQKTNMTVEHPPWMKMDFLLNIGIFSNFMLVFRGVIQYNHFLRWVDESTLMFSGLMETFFKFQGQEKNPKNVVVFLVDLFSQKKIKTETPKKHLPWCQLFFCEKSTVRFKLWWKTFWNLILFLFQGKVWWMPLPDPGGSIRGRMDVVKLNILTLPEIIGLFLVPPKRWYYSILITQLAFFQWYISWDLKCLVGTGDPRNLQKHTHPNPSLLEGPMILSEGEYMDFPDMQNVCLFAAWEIQVS